MNVAELFKKNFVLIPVIASVLFGTFTGVKYVVNLTDTINQSEAHIVNLERDLVVATSSINDLKQRLSAAEATWVMAEQLYSVLADKVREHDYDIKDLNRYGFMNGGLQDGLQIYSDTYFNVYRFNYIC